MSRTISNFKNTILTTVAVAGLAAGAPPQDKPTPADSTRQNSSDRAGSKPTADQQTDNKADRDLAQKIRQSVLDDKTLSTYAHNAKIIVQDGVVTLKGPVRSAKEKTILETKARELAGADHVRNQLSIAKKSN